ncbi:putative phosphoribosylamine--glycine ligase [Selenomonas ruminantium subsp. lactilytica TAM6421]|uniref:Phosphoribosylamine--glycine ligase n=1 Tax=Selenomonas ruminantium subsp. lactilytica (strain NBRC 103574 / TAM6421) TaxID=927704 RepID=I0GNX2_SELRL|nr:phosphoribosylamine--glycine ligase [Selenomonas ruminantium]BAL82459.1 putative phosphoribosylamine--glycine ligase [Selenomonas ruminantium subsp. lactilytica TAM6421]
MNILVIGSGGREHTLAWKLSQSPKADKIYALPGNPGMADVAMCVEGISITDNAAVVDFAQKHDIGLVVVGPEVPLTNGLVDAVTAAGIKAFGPTQAAAQIEGSKAFSKSLMKKYGIPTAKYEVFTEADAAREYIRQEVAPIVIKADGLAAGKGVIVAMTEEEALQAITDIMEDQEFGAAGSRVVIEEFMEGEEASLLCFTDGKTICPMISSQDHKRAYDGDKGPNTGGMGTYAPAPVMTDKMVQEAYDKILVPTIKAMEAEGKPYKGCLYAGLMITAEGPKVVEFNARFGDPETQVVLPLLNSDLVDIMLACADGTLAEQDIQWSDGAAVCVVMAAGGYPKAYKKGDAITGLDDAKAAGALIFHAGTAHKDGQIVTDGGRVLGVVAKADTVRAAVDKAYAGVEKISFKDAFYRKDIAHRALER